MYEEDKIEAVCRKLKCRFNWETDEEIEITLPKGKTYPNGMRYKLFNIEVESAEEIEDYLTHSVS